MLYEGNVRFFKWNHIIFNTKPISLDILYKQLLTYSRRKVISLADKNIYLTFISYNLSYETQGRRKSQLLYMFLLSFYMISFTKSEISTKVIVFQRE